MKVLDSSFLIDYLHGQEDAGDYLLEHDQETFVIPAPAYAEVLTGLGNDPNSDVTEGIDALSWGEVYGVDEGTAVLAGELAEKIGAEGPFLEGMDAIIAAVGHELGAPLVTADRGHTHPETQTVVDVEAYRD